MKYGFAVLTSHGVGESHWEEYYRQNEIKLVRLFKTEAERDNGIKLETERRERKYGEFNQFEILPFVTKY